VIGYVGPGSARRGNDPRRPGCSPWRVSGDNEPVTDEHGRCLPSAPSQHIRALSPSNGARRQMGFPGWSGHLHRQRGHPPDVRQLAGLQAPPLHGCHLPARSNRPSTPWKCTLPISRTGETGYPSSAVPGSVDRDLRRSIEVYNSGRELIQKLYELRKGERPPVTGARDPRSDQGRHAPAARAVQRASRAAAGRDQTHGPKESRRASG